MSKRRRRHGRNRDEKRTTERLLRTHFAAERSEQQTDDVVKEAFLLDLRANDKGRRSRAPRTKP